MAQEVDADDGRFHVGYHKTSLKSSTQGQIEEQGDGPISRNAGSIRRELFVVAFVRGFTYLVARIDARVCTGVY